MVIAFKRIPFPICQVRSTQSLCVNCQEIHLLQLQPKVEKCSRADYALYDREHCLLAVTREKGNLVCTRYIGIKKKIYIYIYI